MRVRKITGVTTGELNGLPVGVTYSLTYLPDEPSGRSVRTMDVALAASEVSSATGDTMAHLRPTTSPSHSSVMDRHTHATSWRSALSGTRSLLIRRDFIVSWPILTSVGPDAHTDAVHGVVPRLSPATIEQLEQDALQRNEWSEPSSQARLIVNPEKADLAITIVDMLARQLESLRDRKRLTIPDDEFAFLVELMQRLRTEISRSATPSSETTVRRRRAHSWITSIMYGVAKIAASTAVAVALIVDGPEAAGISKDLATQYAQDIARLVEHAGRLQEVDESLIESDEPSGDLGPIPVRLPQDE